MCGVPVVSDVTPQPPDVKIYVLPNLFTAGNLIFGFLAILKILEASIQLQADDDTWMRSITASLYCILAACICDLFDGRVARMVGRESPFGREFDSLADVVSFGVAPALLLFKIVLYGLPGQVGWVIASIYLACGALRLARFNCLAAMEGSGGGKEFTGFPIPAAAGVVSSVTLLLIHLYDTRPNFELGYGKYVLAGLMLFLSFMMFSKVRYPSFKTLGWRNQKSIPSFLILVILLVMVIRYHEWMLAVLFLSYLLYGFFRPFLSRAMRREIEEEEEEVQSEP
jgi:CDP-diacylglycerol--serine O-phosphatidyltransferase